MSDAPADPVVSPGVLHFLFEFDHRATGLNVQGVTHEDSLVAAAPGGNPMNWVMGHILANRSFVLTLLGGQPIWSEDDGYCYAEKGAWTDPATQARPWDSLLADFETTQQGIRDGLARVSPEFLAAKHAPDARRPRGLQLHFMQFHEAYHVGQLGLLRRVIGKPGAI